MIFCILLLAYLEIDDLIFKKIEYILHTLLLYRHRLCLVSFMYEVFSWVLIKDLFDILCYRQ